MTLPNLFLAGAPKCGTTSLHNWLDQHPNIHMSGRKEPKYWLSPGVRPDYKGPKDEETAARMVVDRSAYESLFDGGADTAFIGESSPFYLWSAQALRAISREVPNAHVLVVLRRPEERAFSNWAHNWQDGRENVPDVEQAIRVESDRRRRGWEPFWFYEDLGHYGEQVRRLLALFDPSEVHIELFEDLRDGPQEALNRIFEWLDVEKISVDLGARNVTNYYGTNLRARTLQAVRRSVARPAKLLPERLQSGIRRGYKSALVRSAPAAPLDVDVAERLRELFVEDVHTLIDLGVDVRHWLTAPG